jgi:large subunit ribosomal protein L15
MKNKKSKRLGRGYGSGKGGHTSSRGMKGQKSRSKVGVLFEGVKVRKSMLSRLPLLRGKSKFKSKAKPFELKLEKLNEFKTGSTVDVQALIDAKMLRERDVKRGVKIIGGGKLEIENLKVLLPTTASVRETIESLGGSVE